MGLRGGIGRLAVMGGLAAISVYLHGCAGSPAPPVGVWTEGRCVDDSPACIKARQHELSGMLADRQKRWIQQPATAESYAGGVRLFAYKKRKKELSCAELEAAHREAEAGPAVLRGPAGKHLTPAQVSRAVMLSTEVARELQVEKRRRCGR
jgi:hypothetical protein